VGRVSGQDGMGGEGDFSLTYSSTLMAPSVAQLTMIGERQQPTGAGDRSHHQILATSGPVRACCVCLPRIKSVSKSTLEQEFVKIEAFHVLLRRTIADFAKSCYV